MFNSTIQKQAVECDAETYHILSIIAKEAGQSPEGLLKTLCEKYKQANVIERQVVRSFLKR